MSLIRDEKKMINKVEQMLVDGIQMWPFPLSRVKFINQPLLNLYFHIQLFKMYFLGATPLRPHEPYGETGKVVVAAGGRTPGMSKKIFTSKVRKALLRVTDDVVEGVMRYIEGRRQTNYVKAMTPEEVVRLLIIGSPELNYPPRHGDAFFLDDTVKKTGKDQMMFLYFMFYFYTRTKANDYVSEYDRCRQALVANSERVVSRYFRILQEGSDASTVGMDLLKLYESNKKNPEIEFITMFARDGLRLGCVGARHLHEEAIRTTFVLACSFIDDLLGHYSVNQILDKGMDFREMAELLTEELTRTRFRKAIKAGNKKNNASNSLEGFMHAVTSDPIDIGKLLLLAHYVRFIRREGADRLMLAEVFKDELAGIRRLYNRVFVLGDIGFISPVLVLGDNRSNNINTNDDGAETDRKNYTKSTLESKKTDGKDSFFSLGDAFQEDAKNQRHKTVKDLLEDRMRKVIINRQRNNGFVSRDTFDEAVGIFQRNHERMEKLTSAMNRHAFSSLKTRTNQGSIVVRYPALSCLVGTYLKRYEGTTGFSFVSFASEGTNTNRVAHMFSYLNIKLGGASQPQ